ncbi:glycosyltransferase, partial [Patescibacteria group bacterium]|nr:glycosyltransferase [Patescibacteria group bacterium]
IVVNDGSTDKTWSILKSFKRKIENRFFILKTINLHGKGIARNLGIKKAKNEIVVLLDGDIIASRDLLNEHLGWHQNFPKENFAMVGNITWAPELKITPFMYWLEHGGGQLDFDSLKHKQKIDYKHFYTGNSSFKRDFLLKNGLFDEDFGREMYEDLELAYRLQKKGLKVFYNKDARAYHYHQTDPQRYSKRMMRVGKGAKILFEKYPELKDRVSLSRFTFRTILNQIFFPIDFLIGKIFRSIKWMDYYYNAKFFKIYIKGYRLK